jgi:hypothetical protein
MKLSVDMQAIIWEQGRAISEAENIKDVGDLTHAIIKNAKEDKRLHVLAFSRRLLYCCPLP